MGIGSAGLPSYNVLVEGPDPGARERHRLIYMKQAQRRRARAGSSRPGRSRSTSSTTAIAPSSPSAPCRPTPTRGWAIPTLDGVGQLVAEVSPYTADLEWDDINDLDEILPAARLPGPGRRQDPLRLRRRQRPDAGAVSTDKAIAEAIDGPRGRVRRRRWSSSAGLRRRRPRGPPAVR